MRSAASELTAMASRLEEAGAQLTLDAPGMAPLCVGAEPGRARVVFRDAAALEPLARRDHLALAEAHLAGRIDIEGDYGEVMKATDAFDLDLTLWEKLRLWLRLRFGDRLRFDRESIAFHYDRPPEFFLPWFERWRSYSHGLYETPEDPPAEAQARKMQRAIDLLGLEPGMEVLDMGGGWGCFVEYAGRQGIHVRAITISSQQQRFVDDLIRKLELPCSVELVNLFEYEPDHEFDGAVFMGTLEHVPEYDRVAAFLARHLAPGAGVWADFSAQRHSFVLGRFMKKYIWPGPIRYVDTTRVVKELVAAGFNLHELCDDTLSYACTVRDWARGMEAERTALASRWGEETVRAFLLFLWGSYHFLTTNQTQAYHLVASTTPRPVGSGSRVGAASAIPR